MKIKLYLVIGLIVIFLLYSFYKNQNINKQINYQFYNTPERFSNYKGEIVEQFYNETEDKTDLIESFNYGPGPAPGDLENQGESQEPTPGDLENQGESQEPTPGDLENQGKSQEPTPGDLENQGESHESINMNLNKLKKNLIDILGLLRTKLEKKTELSVQELKSITERITEIKVKTELLKGKLDSKEQKNRFKSLEIFLQESTKILSILYKRIGIDEKKEFKEAQMLFGGKKSFTDAPHLPSISQYKPDGTSNIFSPVIEFKNGSNRNDNDKRYSNAYRTGLEAGLKKGYNISGFNPQKRTNMKDTLLVENKVFKESTLGYEDKLGEKDYTDKTTTQNGYIKGDNKDKLGVPGYAYLDPTFWNIPRKRTPVCHQNNKLERKQNSLDPSGFVFGGPSNVMEFHGLGSILPKFIYKQNVNYVESSGDL